MTTDQHIRDVLAETIKILFPVSAEPNKLIKKHIWRDKKYVGIAGGKVAVWRGWSANLVAVDFRYRAIFIDVVENNLTVTEREKLFGKDFAQAITGMPQFVVMFVLDFPKDSNQEIKAQGFIPRIMGRVVHACIVVSVVDFLSSPAIYWAAKTARLVMLQRVLSIHRKPLDTKEVPLQNLLYKTGFLHSYIVDNGLELHELSKPRKSGNFGHDFHAIVKNSQLAPARPFLMGIELYTGPIGYHINTIPQYVNQFQLKGMIIIAKDDPLPDLCKVANNFHLTFFNANKLSEIGNISSVGIHHLPLDLVVTNLASIRDELEALIPTVKVAN
jgi:hypothetical protein